MSKDTDSNRSHEIATHLLGPTAGGAVMHAFRCMDLAEDEIVLMITRKRRNLITAPTKARS